MVSIVRSFTSMHPVNVGVIGDFVVDKYILGTVGRISPEAPVPIVLAQEVKHIPGMAGNVALNLVALGAKVSLWGRLGEDEGGAVFREYLGNMGIDVEGVFVQSLYPTPVKERVIAHSQQLLRVDYEKLVPIDASCEKALLSHLTTKIADLDILALSDYKKGLLTPDLTQKIMTLAKEQGVKVLVDPKGEDYTKYQGAFLIKPNLQEAYLAAKLPRSADLDKVASTLLQATQAEYLLITRSEEGMSLFAKHGGVQHFAVNAREVKDVTGAGDTVLSMMAFAVANHLELPEAIQLANIAASLVIQKMGCAQVNLSEIAQEVVRFAKGSKIFEQEDLTALHRILSKQPYALLTLKDPQSSYELLEALKNITKQASNKLLVYVDPKEENKKLISLLSSLEEVSYIVKSPVDMSELLQKFAPEQAFTMVDDQLQKAPHPLDLLQELLSQTAT